MSDTIKKILKKRNKTLTDEQMQVCAYRGTEAPFTGKYLHNKETGMYICTVCGNALFSSDTKYDSGSGWPSFWDVASQGKVKLTEDNSLGMHRVEATCAKCGSHLGHVFDDGPQDKTGKRYCINSASLDFEQKDK